MIMSTPHSRSALLARNWRRRGLCSSTLARLLAMNLVGTALFSTEASEIPLQGRFTGQQAVYLRRATTPSDWHPSQLAYEDGVASSSLSFSQLDLVDNNVAGRRETTVSPVDFGGDPLGIKDSSAAFRKAIAALRQLCKPDRPDTSDISRTLSSPVAIRRNCGGAVLDLRGGWYSVSEPVRIPAGMGNLWVRGGTIVARKNFSPTVTEDSTGAESFVLIFGHNCTKNWQDSTHCTSNIGVQQLTIDAKKRAGGCLYLDHTHLATVGPGLMILGFSTFGITAFGSGGTIIQGVFAGEYWTHDHRAHQLEYLNGTAIALSHPQNDGYVTNTIIWSAKVGVVSHGTAQHIIGVHPWNFVADPEDGHQTSDVNGTGLGIVVTDGKTRVEDCYFDTVPLVLNMTGSGPLLVSGNLFMKNASVILLAPRWKHAKHTPVKKLVVTDNLFSCSNNWKGSCERWAVLLDETGSKFATVQDTRVEGNTVALDAGYRSTRARKMVTAQNKKVVTIDFSEDLLFPSAALANGSASCSLRNGKPVAYSIMTDHVKASLQLRVKFEHKWTGQVECTVDQSISTRCAL